MAGQTQRYLATRYLTLDVDSVPAPHTDMTTGSNTFDGQAGWEDYIVWHAASQIELRDKNATLAQSANAEHAKKIEQRMALVQLANAEHTKIKQRIAATAPKRHTSLDTRARRRTR